MGSDSEPDDDSGSTGPVERYARTITEHHRAVLVVLLLATLVVGGGIVFLDGEIRMVQFEVDSDERDAMEYVDSNFASTDHRVTLVVVHGGDVLTPESVLETMEMQRAIRGDERVSPTLADDRSTVGAGTVVAFAADPDLVDEGYTIDDEIRAIEGHSQGELAADLEDGVIADGLIPGDRPSAETLLPVEYELGDDQLDARLVLVVHDENVGDDDLLTAQRAIDELVADHVQTTDAFVFGEELTFDRGATATGESFALIGPLALFLVVGLLAIAYRDPVDVLLSVGGLAIVLVWMAGFLGWTGIGFNQLLVAVPCLLIGLSIDHGFHVLMRYREERSRSISSEQAMALALTGVVVAIGATTLTTMIGFLSGLSSPIGVLREFAVVSAFGIFAAFVVFGALIPALKVALDGRRDSRADRESRASRGGSAVGHSSADRGNPVDRDRRVERNDRESEMVGRGPRSIGRLGPVERTMKSVASVSRRAPTAVIVVSLVLALGGIYGLAHVDTSTERTDFLPDGQPAWMESLPIDVGASDHALRSEALLLEETFDREEDHSISVLVEGDPTDPSTLQAVREGERAAIEASTLGERTDGRSIIYSPLEVLDSIARDDDRVADVIDEADTTGDGIPDRDLATVYDAAFETDPVTMGEVVHRNDDGTYESVRLVVTVDGDADGPLVRGEMNRVAETVAGSDRAATATGEPILSAYQDRAVVTTVFATFLGAVLVIAALLTVTFRVRFRSWALGPMTIVPVVVALAWVLGVMAALSIPFNAETAIITGIAVGIGVDYAIHVTERFLQERRERSVDRALEIAVVETGGALLASVATTVAGFGVLALTFVPSLQRFGLLTALLVVCAFLASVLVLPALLYLRANSDDPERSIGDDDGG